MSLAEYKGMRVAVTGATGLIGSYAVKLLVEAGAHVRAVMHKRSPNTFTDTAEKIVSADLMVPEAASFAVRGMDAVISCAGITGGIGLVDVDPLGYVGPASVMALNTLHACHEAHVPRFGFLSSTTVYSAREEPVVEHDLGDAPYPLYAGIGWSKRMLEKICAYYREKTGMKIGIVRPSGAYGRFDNFDVRTSHVIPGMINRAYRALSTPSDTPFEVWGDGQDVRDFIHAQDVARGLLLSVLADHESPINIASGMPVTTAHLAELVLDAVGSTRSILFSPHKPTALKVRTVDVSLAKQILGFESEIGLKNGLRNTVAWLREQQK